MAPAQVEIPVDQIMRRSFRKRSRTRSTHTGEEADPPPEEQERIQNAIAELKKQKQREGKLGR